MGYRATRVFGGVVENRSLYRYTDRVIDSRTKPK